MVSSHRCFVLRLMEVMRSHRVIATQDIYLSSGQVLVSKGQELALGASGELSENLPPRIDCYIEIESTVDDAALWQDLQSTLAGPHAQMFGNYEDYRPKLEAECKTIERYPGISSWLTVLKVCMPAHYEYSLHCLLMAFSMCRALDQDAIDTHALFIGSLMHKVGALQFCEKGPELKFCHEEALCHWSYPQVSVDICHNILQLPSSIIDVIRCSSERLDGTGFPFHILGQDIPFLAQVLGVSKLVVDRYQSYGTYDDYSHRVVKLALRLNDNAFDKVVYHAAQSYLEQLERVNFVPKVLVNAQELRAGWIAITELFEKSKQLAFLLMKNTHSDINRSVASMIGRVATSIIDTGMVSDDYQEWMKNLAANDMDDDALKLQASLAMQNEIREQLERLRLLMLELLNGEYCEGNKIFASAKDRYEELIRIGQSELELA